VCLDTKANVVKHTAWHQSQGLDSTLLVIINIKPVLSIRLHKLSSGRYVGPKVSRPISPTGWLCLLLSTDIALPALKLLVIVSSYPAHTSYVRTTEPGIQQPEHGDLE